jgi:hypothetical protein
MAGFFFNQSKPLCIERDLEALLARMRQRLFPETLPVLGFYWLKTVKASGYGRRQWKQLNRLLKRALGEQLLDGPSRQTIADIQTWVQQTVLVTGQPPRLKPPRLKPPQPEHIYRTLGSDLLQAYINRLLLEWLPAEVARLLTNGRASSLPADGAVPPLVTGRALEGLLVRERLSPRALEMLLQPELLSPHYVYPIDAEILRDVILFLLGRISAFPRSVLPATLLCVAPESQLPANYGEAVHHAFLGQDSGGEEVHVPIAPAQALEITKDEPVRIPSVIVTMDGRWWEAVRVQSGEPRSVVYQPMGRVRLDYIADHVRLRVPYPETRVSWPGDISLPGTLEIFGREWHVSQWEQDAERTWLHLVVSRVLPMTEIVSAEDVRLRRLRPVSIDLAWSALENALTSSTIQGCSEPIERLRQSDLIPLGRAIFELLASLMGRRLPPCEAIESRLRGVRYLEAQVSSKYGRVPWRILPATVHASLFKVRSYPELLEHLNQVFDSLPELLCSAKGSDLRPGKAPMFASATLRRLITIFVRGQQFLNWSEGRELKRSGRGIRL